MPFARAAIALFLALGVVSCEITAPKSLDLCGTWLIQRGATWDTLKSEVSTRDLTPVVTLAKPTGTDVFTVTADELMAMAGTPALGCSSTAATSATRLLHGTFAGVASGKIFTLRADRSTYTSTASGFDLQVPDGATDLLAYTSPPPAPTSTFMLPEKMIVRRGTSYADGANMPVFDFTSSEAFSLESASLSTDLHNQVLSEVTQFISGATTLDMRRTTFPMATTAIGLPEARLKDGEYQLLTLTAAGGVTSRIFYRKVTPTVVPVPAAAASGITSAITSTPCTRIRITIPVQQDYPSFVVATILWSGASSGRLTLAITKDASPSSPFWAVEVPAVESCIIPPDVSYTVSAVVGRGRLGVLRGMIPTDGEQLITSPSPIVRP